MSQSNASPVCYLLILFLACHIHTYIYVCSFFVRINQKMGTVKILDCQVLESTTSISKLDMTNINTKDIINEGFALCTHRFYAISLFTNL